MLRNKHIVLVGEAFGAEEEKWGRPFVGRSGQLLMSALKQCGIERYQVHFTNVCMFRPPNNRPPLPDEITQQYPRLGADVRGFSKVILLGRTAHNTLSPLMGTPFMGIYLSELLGVPISFKGKKFISLWHPAYILRNPKLMPKYVSLLKGALS